MLPVRFIFVVLLLAIPLPHPMAATMIDEVVVTARKAFERIEDVPSSIQVFDGSTVSNNGYIRMEDLSEFSPSLSIQDTLIENILALRGISTQGYNPGFEHSVATFVDGATLSRGQQSLLPMFDVARVEVIRGPQPVYFGQNAIAGAINVVNRRADDDLAYARFSYASQNESLVEFMSGFNVSDQLNLRIGYQNYHFDGWLDDYKTSATWPHRETDTARLSAYWEPSERYSLDLRVTRSRLAQEGSNFEVVNCDLSSGAAPGLCELLKTDPAVDWQDKLDNHSSFGGSLPLPSGTTSINLFGYDLPVVDQSNNPLFQSQDRKLDNTLVTLEQVWNLAAFQLTWQSNFTEYDSTYWTDIDYSPYAIRQAYFLETYKQRSHELRLARANTDMNGSIGIRWQETDITSFNTTFSAFSDQSQGVDYQESAEWLNLFAAYAWSVTQDIDIAAGIRYTRVRKSGSAYQTFARIGSQGYESLPAPVAGAMRRGEINNSRVTGSLTLSQKLGAYRLYLKAVTAFKAGSFNSGFALSPDDTSFVVAPEKARSIEIGLAWTASRFSVRGSIFNSRYDDLQVSVFHQPSSNFITQNAAKAISQGVEFEVTYHLLDALQLKAAGSLLDARYDSFKNARCNFNEVARGECTLVSGMIGSRFVTDRTDEELVYAPSWSSSVSLDYSKELAGFDLTARLSLVMSDGYEASTSYWDDAQQDSYSKVDLRAELARDNWKLALYGRNLTDEQTLVVRGTASVFNGSNAAGILRTRGRSAGVQLEYNF